MDSIATIRSGVARFFSGTMLSRLTGLLRDVVMAAAFGSHPSVAALLVALRLSHMFRRLLGEGALHAAFVPQFEELRKEDAVEASAFFRDLVASLTLILVGLVVLGEGAIFGALHAIDWSAGNREILTLSAWMLPSLIFICLFGLYAALLNCEKSFFIPALAPIGFNLTWTAAALLFYRSHPTEAMPYVALGIVFACLFQWLFTVPRARKSLAVSRPVRLFSPAVRAMKKPLLLGILGVGAIQVNSAIDYLFARWADPSGPAYLWYALRIQHLPIGLLGVGMAGNLLPALSRAIKAGEQQRFRELLTYGLRQAAMILIPFSALLLVAGLAGTHLLFGRGDFDFHSVQQTSVCLSAYAIGLLPTVFVMLLAPSYYARDDYRTPTKAASFSVLLNIALNSVLIFGVKLGPASVALATSAAAFFNMGYLIFHLDVRLGSILGVIGRLLVVSAAAAAVTLVCTETQPVEGFLPQVLNCGWIGLCFGATTLVLGRVLGLWMLPSPATPGQSEA